MGHSVAVAEKHYLGLIRGIPRDARTLEAAMQITTEAQQVIDARLLAAQFITSAIDLCSDHALTLIVSHSQASRAREAISAG